MEISIIDNGMDALILLNSQGHSLYQH
jgi:hypothetical protein